MKNIEYSIKTVLGEELYQKCYDFFQELHERKSDYKIIMTRRCFSLYKIFKPILENNGHINLYGKIITDKAIMLYMSDIIERLEKNDRDVVVTVFDDIIIYGRTINLLLDNIIENLNIPDENELSKYTDKILVRCFLQSEYKPQINMKYEDCVLSQYFGSRQDWKYISSKFSTLIKSSYIANTSYIVSYKKTLTQDELEKFDVFCNEKAISNSSQELNAFNVKCCISHASPNAEINILNRFILTSWIRLYYYPNYETMVLSPLVILKKIDTSEIDEIINKLLESYKLSNTNKIREILLCTDNNINTTKIQLITLLISHHMLCSFLNDGNIIATDKVCVSDFDSNEILSYSMLPSMNDDFHKLTTYWLSSAKGSYDFSANSEKYAHNQDKAYKAFKMQLFRKAMSDNRAATQGKRNRTDGFFEINSVSVFSDQFMPAVLRAIDQGNAALKSVFMPNGEYRSVIYSGEQAFRLMNDSYLDILPYLNSLERHAKIFEVNQYQLYYDFVDFWKNKFDYAPEKEQELREFLKILEETNQEISDVYVQDFNTTDTFDLSFLEEFLNERST